MAQDFFILLLLIVIQVALGFLGLYIIKHPPVSKEVAKKLSLAFLVLPLVTMALLMQSSNTQKSPAQVIGSISTALKNTSTPSQPTVNTSEPQTPIERTLTQREDDKAKVAIRYSGTPTKAAAEDWYNLLKQTGWDVVSPEKGDVPPATQGNILQAKTLNAPGVHKLRRAFALQGQDMRIDAVPSMSDGQITIMIGTPQKP